LSKNVRWAIVHRIINKMLGNRVLGKGLVSQTSNSKMVDLLSISIDPRDDDRVPERLFEARSRCPLMLKQNHENRVNKRVDSNCAYLPNVENLSRKIGNVPLIEFCGSLSETEGKKWVKMINMVVASPGF
jgi:hypothetical protein